MLRAEIEALYERKVAELVGCPELRALEDGVGRDRAVEDFVASVAKHHLRSPRVLAFMYALSPPGRAEASLRHNLLEELGLDEGGVCHPELLRRLVRDAGLGDRLPEIEAEADAELDRYAAEPLLYATLREVGLSALCEVVAFEFMLSRTASRFAALLRRRLGLDEAALAWFSHHAEVDVGHAEEGLDNLVDHARHHGFSEADALAICELALRENVFVKRYFGALAAAAVSRRSA